MIATSTKCSILRSPCRRDHISPTSTKKAGALAPSLRRVIASDARLAQEARAADKLLEFGRTRRGSRCPARRAASEGSRRLAETLRKLGAALSRGLKLPLSTSWWSRSSSVISGEGSPAKIRAPRMDLSQAERLSIKSFSDFKIPREHPNGANRTKWHALLLSDPRGMLQHLAIKSRSSLPSMISNEFCKVLPAKILCPAERRRIVFVVPNVWVCSRVE